MCRRRSPSRTTRHRQLLTRCFARSRRALASARRFPWPPENLREPILSQDAICVSGGNTANMLAIWRVHGIDALLREAWEAGVVLWGASAGMICWFEARRHRLVRAAARRDATVSASCPAAPARTTTARSGAGRAITSWSTAGFPAGSPPTTASRCTTTAPSSSSRDRAGPVRRPTASTPPARRRSRRAALEQVVERRPAARRRPGRRCTPEPRRASPSRRSSRRSAPRCGGARTARA